jgi:hypothetical protein
MEVLGILDLKCLPEDDLGDLISLLKDEVVLGRGKLVDVNDEILDVVLEGIRGADEVLLWVEPHEHLGEPAVIEEGEL